MSVVADHLAETDAAPRAQKRLDGLAVPKLETRVIPGEDWDAAIAAFDDVCQEQLHAFAKSRWPMVKQEPMLFVLDGDVVGGTLMMIQNLPLRLGHIAVSKWAPMLADTSRADAQAIHAGMIEALVAEYSHRRGYMLSVLPRASIEAVNREYDWIIDRGFKRGSELMYPNRYIVNLRQADAALRKGFQQTWRRQLTKSERAGLVFEHATADRLDEFHTLYRAMTDRKQFTDHSAYDTVDTLMSLDEPLRPELFFVRHEGELVYGALIFKAGDRAVYLYGASNDQALPLRAGYFMHWHVIRWLRDHTRATWYDLGGTDGYQGLHQYKKGMVGDAGLIRPVPPVANYASNPLAFLAGTGAFAARDMFYQVRRVLDGWRNAKARPNQSRPSEAEADQ